MTKTKIVESGLDAIVQLDQVRQRHDPYERTLAVYLKQRAEELERLAQRLLYFAAWLQGEIDTFLARDAAENAVHKDCSEQLRQLVGAVDRTEAAALRGRRSAAKEKAGDA